MFFFQEHGLITCFVVFGKERRRNSLPVKTKKKFEWSPLTCFLFFVFCFSGECKQNENCEIFKKMRDEYAFTEENYEHCKEYSHEKCRTIKCRYWNECRAYKRLVDGGYELKDLCHVKVFIHPVRVRESLETM